MNITPPLVSADRERHHALLGCVGVTAVGNQRGKEKTRWKRKGRRAVKLATREILGQKRRRYDPR